MNSPIASLNQWSELALKSFWPMLWQSSLLILVLFGVDLALRQKLRAGVRYALWLVLLAKLLLPPSVALPSGIGWWLQPRAVANDSAITLPGNFRVKYGPEIPVTAPRTGVTSAAALPPVAASPSLLLTSGGVTVSMVLLVWMLIRWRQVTTQVRKSASAPGWLHALLEETRSNAGLVRTVRLRVTEYAMSPAVCGLFRPTVLIPRTLLQELSPAQLRPILLHELTHLRRGDVWVNCCQTLLQIAYWWHPLLWMANARIRRVREEAVDDAVMLGLGADTAVYAPTLLQVARLALQRPMPTLGLVGILESPGSLRQRIERLLDFRPPHRAGLTVVSLFCILGFAAVAVPMGPAPANSALQGGALAQDDRPWPDRRFSGYNNLTLEPRFLIADEISLRSQFPSLVDSPVPLTFNADELISLEVKLSQAGARPYTWAQPLTFEKFSGGSFHWLIGGSVSNQVNYLTREIGGKPIVTGADATFLSTEPDWHPLELSLVPWTAEGGALCQLRLGLAADRVQAKEAELLIPKRGAAVWAVLADPSSHKYQLVVLQEGPGTTATAGSSSMATNVTPRINTLVQDAKLLYEMGNSREAEVTLLKVLQEAPGNQAAAYYLNLIRDAGFRRTQKPARDNSQLEKGDTGSSETKALYTRILKVDPTTFVENLRSATGLAPGNTNSAILPLKEFFSSLGLDLTPPKTVYYKEKQGELLVRASLADLDLIERAINELNNAPPQVNVKVKFVELPVKMAKSFWESLTNSAVRVEILTDPQARVALKALESQEGVKLVNQAGIITLSGRQAQIQWADEQTVLALTNATLTDASSQASAFFTNQVPIGSTVDIYPVVRTDGFTIQLTVSASTTEFLGYDDPGQFVPQGALGGSNLPMTAPLPLPHFRVLQLPKQSAILWDGQTLVLGRSGQTHASDVPVFGGERPLVGRLFRSEPNDKDFIIFLTPTIIDPAGNRVHSAEERPGPVPKSR